jgi:uncharacterized membrane protein (Fun14 family)
LETHPYGVVGDFEMTADISNALITFAFWFGGSSILGLVCGYAIKKVVKIIAVIIGLFVFGIMWLSYSGIARIDWQKAEHVARNTAFNASQQVIHVVNSTAQQYAHSSSDTTTLPTITGVGFLIGFIGGLKKG